VTSHRNCVTETKAHKLHYFDLLWICCTTTQVVQQIHVLTYRDVVDSARHSYLTHSQRRRADYVILLRYKSFMQQWRPNRRIRW